MNLVWKCGREWKSEPLIIDAGVVERKRYDVMEAVEGWIGEEWIQK